MKKKPKLYTNYQQGIVRNIFDYNYVTSIRVSEKPELIKTFHYYSLGEVLRRHSGYKGTIFCAAEHGLPAGSNKEKNEYLNNICPTLFVMSKDRREFIQPYSDKLIIPIGPTPVCYGKDIYSEFEMKAIKRNLGKTLLVFPKHSCEDSQYSCSFYDQNNRFMDEVEEIAKENAFNNIMVCLYYADIYRGAAIGYEKRNWIVVSAGYKANADFADCLTTIIDLSDCVVSQGYGSSAIYAVYREKPLLYIPSSRQIEIADKGVFEDKNEWMLPYEKMLSDLFSEYSEKLTRKQYECCSKIYGFEDVKTPEEMRLLLEFAKEFMRKQSALERIINKDNYALIHSYLLEALDSYENRAKK